MQAFYGWNDAIQRCLTLHQVDIMNKIAHVSTPASFKNAPEPWSPHTIWLNIKILPCDLGKTIQFVMTICFLHGHRPFLPIP